MHFSHCEVLDKLNTGNNLYVDIIYIVFYLFKVFDLVLEDDAVGAIRLGPRKGDAALPRMSFPHHAYWGGCCRRKRNNIKMSYSFRYQHRFSFVHSKEDWSPLPIRVAPLHTQGHSHH